MGIGKRFLGLVRRISGTLFAPADDPRKVYAPTAERYEQVLRQFSRSIEQLEDSRGKLTALIASTEARLPRLRAQAKQALRSNRGDLARLLMNQVLVGEKEIGRIQRRITKLEAERQRLRTAKSRLAAEVETLLARQELATARVTTEEVHQRVSSSIQHSIHELSAIEEALKDAEAQADSIEEQHAELDELMRGTRADPDSKP
jgi:phage shock protein A